MQRDSVEKKRELIRLRLERFATDGQSPAAAKKRIDQVLTLYDEPYATVLRLYFEGKSLAKISELTNIEPIKLKRTYTVFKSDLEKFGDTFDELLKLGIDVKIDSSRDVGTLKHSLSVREQILKRAEGLDIETEVEPYLKADHREIYDGIVKNLQSQLTISRNANYNHDSVVSRKIDTLMNFIDEIKERKAEVNKFVEEIGGESNIEDFELFLTDFQKVVLERVMLSINPRAVLDLREELNSSVYDYSYIVATTKAIMNKLNDINAKKDRIEKFIKENGGEDFLINEFGNTLDDAQFYILINCLMDYHYSNFASVGGEIGNGCINFVTLSIKSILKKLEDYKSRKAEVDSLIEAAGGAEAVIEQLYSKLTEKERTVFEERILAYAPKPIVELSKSLHVHHCTIAKMEKRQREKLEEMAKNRQKLQ